MVSRANCKGNYIIESDYERVNREFKNVLLYVLSNGLHPNNYKYSSKEAMQKIEIQENEFVRLFSYIYKK